MACLFLVCHCFHYTISCNLAKITQLTLFPGCIFPAYLIDYVVDDCIFSHLKKNLLRQNPFILITPSLRINLRGFSLIPATKLLFGRKEEKCGRGIPETRRGKARSPCFIFSFFLLPLRCIALLLKGGKKKEERENGEREGEGKAGAGKEKAFSVSLSIKYVAVMSFLCVFCGLLLSS